LTGATGVAVATAAVVMVGWGQQDHADDVEDAVARCQSAPITLVAFMVIASTSDMANFDGGAVEGLDGAGDDIRARECSDKDMLGHQHGPAHHDRGHEC